MYKKIESEYNHYIFSKDKKIGLTAFKKQLAEMVGTTLSNIYEIIKAGLIEIYNYDYTKRIEFSADTAFQNRTKKAVESNASKRLSSKPFVDLIIKELRSEYNINSVDEIINDLKLNRQHEIEGMETICTATFYNYVEQNKIDNFSKNELPMKTKRKTKNNKKNGKTDPKGTSIEERPFKPEDRTEFGHWEGDTIVKAIKKLKIKYPELKEYKINEIFKSFTFDNGVEFSNWIAIEKYLKTTIYFAHPYSSCERDSNENENKLLRRFLPKSCNINNYIDGYVMFANELINTKIRRFLGINLP